MIETLFILFLYMNNKAIEYTPKDSLGDCLGSKRQIERNLGDSNRYSCEKHTVKTMEKTNGKKEIVEFIED